MIVLPLKGKRKPNGHREIQGKQAFRCRFLERERNHPKFETKVGHLEGDTIVGVHHNSVVVALVESLSKVIVTLNPDDRKTKYIEKVTGEWLDGIHRSRI